MTHTERQAIFEQYTNDAQFRASLSREMVGHSNSRPAYRFFVNSQEFIIRHNRNGYTWIY